MAKISEIIKQMEQMLDSADQSNSLKGQRLAESYADICNDVNDSLAECQSLFLMGAYSEARKLNAKAKPPFTERCRILNFPRRQDWIELCRIYNWPTPPDLNEQVIKLLLDNDDKQLELSIEELQSQWRRIIRDGSLHEKLILARKIYALAPTGVWKANLLNVEHPWVKELKNNAEAALKEGRLEEVAEIYTELTSAELLHKPSETDLKKFREATETFRKQQIEKKKKDLLEEIACCYLSMMLPELDDALTRWADLEDDPLFSITTEEQLQISDARTFFQEQQAQANAEQLFFSLQNQLETLLNDEADPREIERIYHSLQQLDRPINPILEERVKDLDARLAMEASRRHFRRCIYWGSSALALTLLIFTGIFLIQRELELRRDSAKIREMVTARHFDAALQYCDKIAQDRPATAKRAAIVALRKEIEGLRKEAAAAAETFDDICQKLRAAYFNTARILDQDVETLFSDLDARAKLLPEEKISIKNELFQQYLELRNLAWEKNEAAFIREISVFQKKMNSFMTDMETLAEADASTRPGTLKMESSAMLHKYQSKIRKESYEQWNKNFNDYNAQMDKKLQEYRQLLADTQALSNPGNLEDYNLVLQLARSRSDKLFSRFETASKQFPSELALQNLLNAPEKLLPVINQYLYNPLCRDIYRADMLAKLHFNTPASRLKKVDYLRKNILEKEYKVRELIMTDNQNTYFFYLENPAEDIEVEWNWEKSLAKAAGIRFLTGSGSKADAVFRLTSDEVKTGKGKRSRPPISFDEQCHSLKLEFMPYQKCGILPKFMRLEKAELLKNHSKISYARHYLLLKDILQEFSGSWGTAEILHGLLTAAGKQEFINVYAQAGLIKHLLTLMPVSNDPLYRDLQELSQYINQYTSAGRENWQDPRLVYTHRQEVSKFSSGLEKLKLKEKFSRIIFSEKLLKNVTRNPVRPVGIFYQETNGAWSLHPFKYENDVFLYDELVIMHKDDELPGKSCFTALVPAKFAAPVPSAQIAPELLDKLYHGQLVYAKNDSWTKVFRMIAVMLQNDGYPIPENIIWPESWPVNRRNINELMKK